MACTTANGHVYAQREEHHKPRQEDASANSSLITVLAIATVAMLGLTLAAYFGAFGVSPVGLVACYIGVSVAGLSLIVATALRCIRGSKFHDSSKDRHPIHEGRLEISPNEDRTTVTITTGEEERRQVVVPFTDGNPSEYDFNDGTHCVMYIYDKYFHVIGQTADKKVIMYELNRSPALERLFDAADAVGVPRKKEGGFQVDEIDQSPFLDYLRDDDEAWGVPQQREGRARAAAATPPVGGASGSMSNGSNGSYDAVDLSRSALPQPETKAKLTTLPKPTATVATAPVAAASAPIPLPPRSEGPSDEDKAKPALPQPTTPATAPEVVVVRTAPAAAAVLKRTPDTALATGMIAMVAKTPLPLRDSAETAAASAAAAQAVAAAPAAAAPKATLDAAAAPAAAAPKATLDAAAAPAAAAQKETPDAAVDGDGDSDNDLD